MRPGSSLPTLLILGLFSVGCREQEERYEPHFGTAPRAGATGEEYTFGVFPLHNPMSLFAAYEPIVEAANARASGHFFALEAGTDYPSFERKLRDKRLAFAVVNPLQAVRVENNGYRLFAKMSSDERMRGVLVVRKDGPIHSFEDLRGARISFPARSATAATMLTKVFLRKHGIDADQDMEASYVGSQDSAVMNVFLGNTAVGGAWLPLWEFLSKTHPEVAGALEVRWQTESTVGLGVVARTDVAPEIVEEVQTALLGMGATEEGRRALTDMGTATYEVATTNAYDPFREFLGEYEKLFGAVPESGQ